MEMDLERLYAETDTKYGDTKYRVLEVNINMHEYTCCTLTWLMRSKAPLLGKIAEFLESIDTVCCKQNKRVVLNQCEAYNFTQKQWFL